MSNYPPIHHVESDEQRVFAAIDAIQQATLILPDAVELDVAFTPLFLDRGRRVLAGHVAGRNPQANVLDGARIHAIFHGPHAYISPKHNDNDDVPTWNYVNVHVRGVASVIADESAKWAFMQRLVRIMEGDRAEAYLDFYGKRLRNKLSAITCFEMTMESVVGRFKLGRNDLPDLQKKTFDVLRSEAPLSLRGWLESLAPEN